MACFALMLLIAYIVTPKPADVLKEAVELKAQIGELKTEVGEMKVEIGTLKDVIARAVGIH